MLVAELYYYVKLIAYLVIPTFLENLRHFRKCS